MSAFIQPHKKEDLCVQAGVDVDMCACVNKCVYPVHTAYVYVQRDMCACMFSHAYDVAHIPVLAAAHRQFMSAVIEFRFDKYEHGKIMNRIMYLTQAGCPLSTKT